MPATGDGRASAAAARFGTADAAETARRAGTGTSTPTTAAAGRTAAGRPVAQRAKGAADTGAPGRSAHPEGAREPAPIPHPRTTSPERGEPSDQAPYRLLVIADGDTEDLSLIESLVAESGARVELHRAEGIEEAAALLAPVPMAVRRNRSRPVDFNCVLLDLAAPAHGPHGGHAVDEHFPSDGLDGLRELRRRAPHVALVVLTDAAGAELGAAAVAAGAQDFLVKRETDGPLLARALRYAVERKRADESQRRLVEAELRGQENARLQRHLLPTPLLDGAGLAFTRRYRPGRRRALLGGDFYDAVRTDDGTVHVVIGDVCGHGPDEAALGVALRIAWRTLVFAGLTGQELLTTLQHVLEHERRSDEIFATLCMLVLVPGPGATDAAPADGTAPSGTADGLPVETARLFLAGHPAPLLLGPEGPPRLLPADQAGPALGLLPCDDGLAAWPAVELDLQPGWSLLLYTDGLVEGRVGAGSRRLGQDGLIELIADHHATGLTRGRLVDSALAEVEELNGGSLTDDVAVLLLERNPVPALMG
ncbi:PP2C family protein-serine/threonine phosphatase [Kitasatospora sp. DSM 101779]|uniref:PP2C family protein-serine/threonine phosphatase n=1 Tax=Kitasatospora sp. DSM 101779 TaxID=2853165 RepID=UPI0021D8B627|nr:SpoIIE family protein phosphatase [Kitasatospora sp. DSM 101779]MCU7824053.1 SpoIIE family protein phosphatase [Kitasatospora sp. DSM 101779]